MKYHIFQTTSDAYDPVDTGVEKNSKKEFPIKAIAHTVNYLISIPEAELREKVALSLYNMMKAEAAIRTNNSAILKTNDIYTLNIAAKEAGILGEMKSARDNWMDAQIVTLKVKGEL